MAQWHNKGSIIRTCILIIAIIWSDAAIGQINRDIQQGNKLYEQQRYQEAAKDYAKALSKDPTNVPGLFNFGNSLYQQKQYDSSRKVMEATAKIAKNSSGKAAAHYNIGNSYMSQQKWEDAVSAYKNTLRNNPQDADAKYNLSYAEQMLKKQQQQDKDKKDKDKQNKDQQDNKDQQNKDNKDKKDQDKKDQDQKNDQDKKDDQNKEQQQPQSQPSKLSQQQAEQLLNALQQEEKKLQDKMKKEKGVPVKMQKDW
jgi:tetratricopeptide (TPR) repeat protein